MSLVAPPPGPPTDPLDGVADLLPQVWQDVVVDTVRGVHSAVAERVFSAVPASGLVRGVHDGIASAVYEMLGLSGRGAQSALRTLVRASASSRNPEVMEASSAWRFVVAALNGVIGDVLEEEGNPLAIRTAVRRHGRDVTLTRRGLEAAYPDATPRIGVLVHGLAECEDSWDRRVGKPGTVSYTDLFRDNGFTPVLVRFNSGRHVHDNAADLAGVLDLLVERWPVPVEEVVPVGHSMGGLVIRGAADIAATTDMRWASLVEHCVMLGSPHSGATLEKLTNLGAWLLSEVPEAAPFGAILRRRSAGIRDLRHGYVRRTDWHGQDPHTIRGRAPDNVDPPSGTRIHNVGATVGSTPDDPLSYIAGDLLVNWNSARAADKPWAAQATVTHVGQTDHFGLLNHPQVAKLLLDIVRHDRSRDQSA